MPFLEMCLDKHLGAPGGGRGWCIALLLLLVTSMGIAAIVKCNGKNRRAAPAAASFRPLNVTEATYQLHTVHPNDDVCASFLLVGPSPPSPPPFIPRL